MKFMFRLLCICDIHRSGLFFILAFMQAPQLVCLFNIYEIPLFMCCILLIKTHPNLPFSSSVTHIKHKDCSYVKQAGFFSFLSLAFGNTITQLHSLLKSAIHFSRSGKSRRLFVWEVLGEFCIFSCRFCET